MVALADTHSGNASSAVAAAWIEEKRDREGEECDGGRRTGMHTDSHASQPSVIVAALIGGGGVACDRGGRTCIHSDFHASQQTVASTLSDAYEPNLENGITVSSSLVFSRSESWQSSAKRNSLPSNSLPSNSTHGDGLSVRFTPMIDSSGGYAHSQTRRHPNIVDFFGAYLCHGDANLELGCRAYVLMYVSII